MTEHRPNESQVELMAAIFAATADASPEERERLLNELCPDAEVRELAAELLVLDASTDLFLDKSPLAMKHAPECGQSIGPYKLLQSIGQGGMGIVYLAQQIEPVRRKVALKLIKPGVDTKQVLARFHAERQALSVMDHPNIARVLDAGETEAGRPYFVMELVKGTSITEYCRQNRLSTRERLELFIPVCHAIQHAHQKGIIHRDLKPSNVLVAEYDRRPAAKVIDFGVAKAIYEPLTELTMFTGFGQIIGTFEYMSPEQSRVNQLDVDTRCDIYGLGVLLYELLTGCTPFDRNRLNTVDWEEMLRIIREEDPPLPSTRLSETARVIAAESETQSFEPAKVSRIVRGEVDWIVMKALEKDRERRYATAQAMADDISCFLNGDSVAACPPTMAYRLKNFVRRNQAALLTTSLVFAALIVGLSGTTWQAYRARVAEANALEKQQFAEIQQARAQASEQEAIAAAERANAISRYLRNDLLGLDETTTFANTEVKFDADLKLVTLLERAKQSLETRFFDNPIDKIQIQRMLIESYCSIGRYDIASSMLQPLVAQLVAQKGETHPSVIEGKKILITLELQQANWQEAKRLTQDLLRLKRQVYGSDDPRTWVTLLNLAVTCKVLGDDSSAEIHFEEYLRLCAETMDSENEDVLNAKRCLAVIKAKRGDTVVAELRLAQVLQSQRKQEPRSNQVADTLQEIGRLYLARKRYSEAEELLRESLDICQQRLAPDSPHTLTTKFDLATTFLAQGRLRQAEPIRQEFIEWFGNNLKFVQASTVEQMELHAELLMEYEQFAAAEQLVRLAEKISEAHGGSASVLVGTMRSVLGESLCGQGKLEEAESNLLSGYEILSNLRAANLEFARPRLLQATRRLVEFYDVAGDASKMQQWEEKYQSLTND